MFTCKVEGCDFPVFRHGLCQGHHYRQMKYGDVNAGGTMRGAPLKWIEEVALKFQSDECLIWPFSKNAGGSANIRINGKTVYVARIICERVHGLSPSSNHQTAHSCGNGHLGCVNPLHLRWATRKENMEEMVHHGMSTRGARNGSAKLSATDVRKIRRLAKEMKQQDIANRFGVANQQISRIVRGEKWGWLG